MELDPLRQTGFDSSNHLAEFLAGLAVAAGARAMPYFEQGCRADLKADGTPVTAADVETQAFIADALRRRCPQVPICGEENGQCDLSGPAEAYFLIDPVDGTKEFIRGSPEWTVNIGFVANGRPLAGAVAVPVQGSAYWGGTTAFRSLSWGDIAAGMPIRVRPMNLQALTALCSRDHRGPRTELFFRRLGIAHAREAGSSLKMLLIAAGEADIYPRLGPTMAWDTAAAHAVLCAAGGDLFTCEGEVLTYDCSRLQNPDFIALGTRRMPASVLAAVARE